jgi:hypothetical protein
VVSAAWQQPDNLAMTRTGFKGNKQALPSKPCVACGRAMSWRKAWAKNWAEVKFCSDACRRAPARSAAAASRG